MMNYMHALYAQEQPNMDHDNTKQLEVTAPVIYQMQAILVGGAVVVYIDQATKDKLKSAIDTDMAQGHWDFTDYAGDEMSIKGSDINFISFKKLSTKETERLLKDLNSND